jgi:hypothetical protein
MELSGQLHAPAVLPPGVGDHKRHEGIGGEMGMTYQYSNNRISKEVVTS